jgi:hypothetical protein
MGCETRLRREVAFSGTHHADNEVTAKHADQFAFASTPDTSPIEN